TKRIKFSSSFAPAGDLALFGFDYPRLTPRATFLHRSAVIAPLSSDMSRMAPRLASVSRARAPAPQMHLLRRDARHDAFNFQQRPFPPVRRRAPAGLRRAPAGGTRAQSRPAKRQRSRRRWR